MDIYGVVDCAVLKLPRLLQEVNADQRHHRKGSYIGSADRTAPGHYQWRLMLTGAQTAELCKKGGATEVGIFTCDLTVSEARIRLIDEIVKAHGHIDVLVREIIKHLT